MGGRTFKETIMIKPNTKLVKKYLREAQDLWARSRSPLKKMTQAQLLKHLRKTRQEVWEEKMNALRARHK